MPLSSGPNSVTLGITASLDAGDRKNSFLPFSTFLNMSTWALGSGGCSGYNQNGNTNENERVTGTDPWSNSTTVWESRPSGDNYADGGWNTDWYNIDRTKLYRFSVWVKRTTTSSGGTSYFGLYGNTGGGVERLDGGGTEGNPYWECNGTGAYTKDVWYLLVGHCFPYGTVGVANNKHPDTGRYTVDGRNGDLNFCNIGGDVKWLSDTTQTLHRTYHYYCADNTTRLQWFDPRIDLCDGTEPSISDLLIAAPNIWRNALGGSVKGSLTNGISFTPNNKGALILDGTNDYIDFGSDIEYKSTGGWTVESIVNYSAVAGGYNNITSPANFIGSETISYNSWYWSVLDNKLALWNMSPGVWKYGSTTLQPNNWYHAVLVCKDGGTSYQMYLNGVAESGDHTTYVWNPSYAGLKVRYIGRGNAANVRVLNGQIATTKIYTRELSATDVLNNYLQYKTRFNLGAGAGTTEALAAVNARDILLQNPNAQSGTYWIKPSGSAAFQVPVKFFNGKALVCVMKGGGGNGFEPDDSYWENSTIVNASDYSLYNQQRSKYSSYSTVPFTDFYLEVGLTTYPVTFTLPSQVSSMQVAQQRNWNDSSNRSSPHYWNSQDYRTVPGADPTVDSYMGSEIYMYGMDLKHEGHYGGGGGSSGGRIRVGSILDENTGNTGGLNYGTAGSAFGIGVNGGNPLKTGVCGYGGWSNPAIINGTADWSLWIVN
jgi:hypothetical protein